MPLSGCLSGSFWTTSEESEMAPAKRDYFHERGTMCFSVDRPVVAS